MERGRPVVRAAGQLTNSTAIWSTSDKIVVEVQVLVKNLGVKLDLAVKALAKLFPACSGMSGVHRMSSSHACHEEMNT
jgi:hypothetical protein